MITIEKMMQKDIFELSHLYEELLDKKKKLQPNYACIWL